MNNRIRELREEAHMTQVRLSIELEVSQETISAYESGKHYPSVASLLKLSQIFNSSCDYILGLSDIRVPNKKSTPNVDTVLLTKWSLLDNHQRDLAIAYINGLIDMKKSLSMH